MIDEIDLHIINILYSSKKIRTWGIMKIIYPNGRDTEHSRIIAKLNKLKKYGIVLNNEGYTLLEDCVKYSKHRFPDGFKNSLSLFLNGRWVIFSLN